MERISEIWIINESGAPLFNRSNDITVDPTLFCGFLSAIQGFVQTSFQGNKLDKLILGKIQLFFLYIERYKIFIVVRTDKKTSDKDMKIVLEKIGDLFIARFHSILTRPLGDISDFLSFNEDLTNLLGPSKLLKQMTNWFESV